MKKAQQNQRPQVNPCRGSLFDTFFPSSEGQKAAVILYLDIFLPTDNVNIKRKFLYRYLAIARNTGYYVILVEPKTSWKYSISDLALNNHCQATEQMLREQLAEFERIIIAIYYGWFVSEDNSSTLKDKMFEMLHECCTKIHSFKDDFVKDSQQGEYGKFT